MTKPLPIKLGKEPLVEAVCQIRVAAKIALNTVFPGLLLAKFNANISDLQQLPAATLPEQVRATQPEMAFMPLVQLKFKNVMVMIGERAVTVSNAMPYLGWVAFKPLIVEIFSVLFESKLVSNVERYSLKYTNVLKAGEVPDSLDAIDWTLKVGTLDLNMRSTTLRTEIVTEEVVTIVNLSGGVTAQAEGREPIQGSLIDIDTIRQNKKSCEDFAESMPQELDLVRDVNKAIFFECLTNEAIYALDPLYE